MAGFHLSIDSIEELIAFVALIRGTDPLDQATIDRLNTIAANLGGTATSLDHASVAVDKLATS